MFCPNCGREISDEKTNYCPKCGTALGNQEVVPSNKEEETTPLHSVNLRVAMFIISAISAVTAIIVYMYGHNAFYDDVWISSSPKSRFWERGNGISVFIFLLVLTIITFVIGLCCKKEKK